MRRKVFLRGIFLFSFSIVLSTDSFVSFPSYISLSLFAIILAPDDETQSSLKNLGKFFIDLRSAEKLHIEIHSFFVIPPPLLAMTLREQ